MKNYKKLKVHAQTLRDKTNFSVKEIASFLGVSPHFINHNTTDKVNQSIRIIEDWVCEYDDIRLLGIKYKRSNEFIQSVIDKYFGKNEKNICGLKSKV